MTQESLAGQSILDLSLADLERWLLEAGERPFRAKQLYHWVYQALASDFASMANLPISLRDKLSETSAIDTGMLVAEQVSDNGLTRKALLRLQDGNTIESVLMQYRPSITSRARRTICVSSQVGCPVGCHFCATGRTGLARNLTTGEIVGQVLHFARLLRQEHGPDASLTNIVFMGQGEPLANFSAVWAAIERLNSPYGFNLGARHITISTVGMVPQILVLADKPLQIGLAVSLHATDDAVRDFLVPMNSRYPIAQLLEACRRYIARTNRRVTFEYSLIEGVNDSLHQAEQLADLLHGMLSHVNLIPFNSIDESEFRAPRPERVLAFQQAILRKGVAVTVRRERGGHIDAACGQLRGLAAG